MVVTATTADAPFLTEAMVADTTLVVNLGLREVHREAILARDCVVVDDYVLCSKQDTPLGACIRAGAFAQKVEELATVLEADSLRSHCDGRRIFYQPAGMVALDLLIAAKIAMEQTGK